MSDSMDDAFRNVFKKKAISNNNLQKTFSTESSVS
ncbi:hypothetical protein GGD38_000531 [Chitinophagaceae bacterium OAS944]|nr:hypothetical protein [Chitinophagaceae bacterium OAS944]